MLKRLFREEPELMALAVIVLFFAASAVDPVGLPQLEGSVYFPQLPDVWSVAPDLPPPVNPIELIRF